MKVLMLLMLLCCPLSVWAQNSYLSVKNPSPRVGDEIVITYSLKKENLEYLENKKSKSIDEFNKVYSNYYGSGELKLSDVATEPGIKQFGPFEFRFENRIIKTDSIKLEVIPALPNNKNQGLWMRVVEFAGTNYLIVEERIPGEWKTTHAEDQLTFTHSIDGKTFAELDEIKFESKGVDIVSTSTSSRSQNLSSDSSKDNIISYRIFIYEFKKTNEFKGRFEVNTDMFKGYSGKSKVDRVWID